MYKPNRLIISAAIVIGVLALAGGLITTNNNIELKQLDLKTKQTEINTLEEQLKIYDQKLKQADGNEKRLQELRKQQETLKSENSRLQSELQAKLDRQAEEASNAVIAASVPTPAPAPTQQPSGDCHTWMRQAGIAEHDMADAYALIMRESGCNPNAQNPSSGAGGIPQALPYSKTGCAWGDPICQIKWMIGYVNARYGGFPQANAFQIANNWY